MHFQCGKTQIYECLAKRKKITEMYHSSRNLAQSKRFKESNFDKLNEVVFEWFCVARSKNFPISCPILQAEALKIASKLHIENYRRKWMATLL